eukprot:JP436779.1.p1 GENE.JP436779.1~~JP436779.1.p1  ORF type:complete len:188 (-),score=35.96 JP436779.1:41-604(-)
MSVVLDAIGSFFSWLKSLFWSKEMELTMIGPQNAGKTTLLNVLTTGSFPTEDMIPTVGFNMRRITKNNVVIKMWDLGGQPRFHCMWERYCRGVNCIIFVLDAADETGFERAKTDLHDLLSKPSLQGIPLLVLGNKNDLSQALTVEALIETLNLGDLKGREVCCYSVSAKNQTNLDVTIEWIVGKASK